MSDKDERHIDDLFRKGSEQHAFPYNPDAWNEMEALLDKEDRKRGIIWWLLGMSGVFLLVLVIFYGLSDKSVDEVPLTPSVVKEEVKTSNQENPGLSEKGDILQKINEVEGPEITVKENTDKTPKIIKRKVKENVVFNDVTQKEISLNSSIIHPVEQENQLQKSSSDLSREDTPELSIQTNFLSPLPYLTLQPIPFESTLRLKGIEENLPDEIPLAVDEEEKEGPNGFCPGLTFASEISGVGAIHLENLDWKLGAEMQYRFKKSWALSLGVNYVHKNYDADYVDYHVPDGFWVRGIEPTYARGDCHMIEFPLQIGYFHKGFTQSSWFVQGGLTTYFMLSERYYYYYVEADPDLLRYWHTDESSSYWMGVAQVNAGYQFHLGKESFRFGPYVQIPLQGMGFGGVQLYSGGIQFNYNFKI